MRLAITLASVVGGLVLGGLAGFRMGRGIESRRSYWLHNIVAVAGCAALDFAGLVTGHYWVAYSALGLMGGLITGLKYGYAGSAHGWRSTGTEGPPVSEPIGPYEGHDGSAD